MQLLRQMSHGIARSPRGFGLARGLGIARFARSDDATRLMRGGGAMRVEKIGVL